MEGFQITAIRIDGHNNESKGEGWWVMGAY